MMADMAKILQMVTPTWKPSLLAECSSESAAFPEETLTELQINFNNPTVSRESLESANKNNI